MPQPNAYAEYLESQVLSADPVELVRLLYRAAVEATRRARCHLAAGQIAERSRQISKTHAILTQLSLSLDHSRGQTVSHSLAELYDYMQRRLIEANARQIEAPLVEVESLLATLLEGWENFTPGEEPMPSQAPPRPAPDEIRPYRGFPACFAPETGYASQNWSL
ncbi:MAG: flagellar export chaperone FliS [Bryobacteraceae bacterium]|jgi:flagellar secretion chaperone FliS